MKSNAHGCLCRPEPATRRCRRRANPPSYATVSRWLAFIVPVLWFAFTGCGCGRPVSSSLASRCSWLRTARGWQVTAVVLQIAGNLWAGLEAATMRVAASRAQRLDGGRHRRRTGPSGRGGNPFRQRGGRKAMRSRPPAVARASDVPCPPTRRRGTGARIVRPSTEAAEAMRVAIIDYGSGNLRSATKAFERAAREGGSKPRSISPTMPAGSPPPTASFCPASAPMPIAAPASTPCPA